MSQSCWHASSAFAYAFCALAVFALALQVLSALEQSMRHSLFERGKRVSQSFWQESSAFAQAS